jgi:hypothetical protein
MASLVKTDTISNTGASSPVITLPTSTSAASWYTGRNYIINGNFDVWQRGTSFTGANDWTADRWLIHANGSSPSTTRQTFTVGQTDVSNFPKYYLRYNAGTSPSAVGEVNQRVEDVTVLGGKEITISLWAKAASGTPNLGLAIIQNFGSGGSSANVQLDNATLWTLSTTWQKFTHTITIDSITGKTVGASSYTQFRIKMAQDAINKDVAQVQVEEGATATPFEHKTYGQELAACERYYQTKGMGLVGGIEGTSATVGIWRTAVTLAPEMRAAPTVGVGSSTITYNRAGVAAHASISNTISWTNNITTKGLVMGVGNYNNSGGSANDLGIISGGGSQFTFDAEL